jgi:hypothetical protein
MNVNNNEKFDLYFKNNNYNTNCINMKPLYLTNEELNCAIIKYGDKNYLMDFSDRDNIINFTHKFKFNDNSDIYPSYLKNYKKYNYLDFIYKINLTNSKYYFKNENIYDLRRVNVEIYHVYHDKIVEKYQVIEYIRGHSNSMGDDAIVMKNPIWRILDDGKQYLLMYCEKDTICKLCQKSYDIILDFEKNIGKKLCWHKLTSGYLQTQFNGKHLYMHQLIMNCYSNGYGTLIISVDHIDRDPLNNCFDNLRLATREEQEQNKKHIIENTRKERKHNARELPEGITNDMMERYVVYYFEWLNKEKTKSREFFKIEKHPKLNKIWISSKSEKVSIKEKLDKANKVVKDLENDIIPVKEGLILPKYVSLVTIRDKEHLVFEKRKDSIRLNIKMDLKEGYDIDNELIRLDGKIKEKYENEKSIFD